MSEFADKAPPVKCESCRTLFPARYRWEPSLPPHNCTERAQKRRELIATLAEEVPR